MMSGGNTPGSETPDPQEAREPPDFASHPQEAYDFVCSVLEESIAAKEKYKAKYAGTNAQNKKLRSIVHEKIGSDRSPGKYCGCYEWGQHHG